MSSARARRWQSTNEGMSERTVAGTGVELNTTSRKESKAVLFIG